MHFKRAISSNGSRILGSPDAPSVVDSGEIQRTKSDFFRRMRDRAWILIELELGILQFE